MAHTPTEQQMMLKAQVAIMQALLAILGDDNPACENLRYYILSHKQYVSPTNLSSNIWNEAIEAAALESDRLKDHIGNGLSDRIRKLKK